MCELSRKPMVICSEVIETVSLSGYTKLSSDGNYNTSKTLLTKYKNRTIDLHLSLHDFFHKIKNQSPKKGREYVPHYVGGSGQPVYPDKDTLDTLAVASNIGDVTDTIENIENSEIHSGKNYDWGKRLYEVRINLYILFSFCFLKLTFGYFFTEIENLTLLLFFFLFLLDANRRGSMANKRDKCLQ